MASEAPLKPGTVLGGEFEITGPLARGGMGTVYNAKRRGDGLVCALKVMHAELLDQERSRERFIREADLCQRIESDHVVKVIASGIEEAINTPWIAMELVEGEDLEKICRTRGAFPLADAREVLSQLFDAIGAAHAVGVVHRDLKPQNVLLSRREDGAPERVKVLDFGISKVSKEQGTETTAAVGSPLWMAPEQAQRGRLTPATDVFALALIAFRLLTGRMYWLAATHNRPAIKEILVELLMKPLPPASSRAKALGITAPLPAGFDGWFDRAIERDPTRRFSDAHTAWKALAPILEREPVTATEAPPESPAPAPAEADESEMMTVALSTPRRPPPAVAESDPPAPASTPPSPATPAPAAATVSPAPIPLQRSVLRSPTPTPIPELLQAARVERGPQKRSPALLATVLLVGVVLLVALIVVGTRH